MFEQVKGNTNLVAKGDGFRVSYLPGGTANNGLPALMGAPPEGETALIVRGSYFILNGDHREQYTKLIPQGQGACLKYFNENSEKYRSPWSE